MMEIYQYPISPALSFLSCGAFLESSSTPDDIMAAYNVGNENYVEKVNYLLDLDVYPGWEYEYDEKF